MGNEHRKEKTLGKKTLQPTLSYFDYRRLSKLHVYLQYHIDLDWIKGTLFNVLSASGSSIGVLCFAGSVEGSVFSLASVLLVPSPLPLSPSLPGLDVLVESVVMGPFVVVLEGGGGWSLR